MDKKLVVWLHGYGANGSDLKNIPLDCDAFVLSPDAPFVCEEFPYGFQWFSLRDRSFESIRSGLDNARPIVTKYIKEEAIKNNIPLSKCFVLGFSQGAMLAMDLIFSFEELGGIVAFSGGFFPSKDPVLLNKNTDIVIIHGTNDEVVPYSYMKASSNSLSSLGFSPKTLSCNNASHTITNEGISFASNLIKNSL